MKKHIFEVHEFSNKNGIEVYPVTMTDVEMRLFLKAKRETNGYIQGIGGDKKYSIYATYMIH